MSARFARPKTLALDSSFASPKLSGIELILLFILVAPTRFFQINVLHQMPAKSRPTSLLNMQKHHDVGPIHSKVKIIFLNSLVVDQVCFVIGYRDES